MAPGPALTKCTVIKKNWRKLYNILKMTTYCSVLIHIKSNDSHILNRPADTFPISLELLLKDKQPKDESVL